MYVLDKFQLKIFLTTRVIFGCGNNIQKILKKDLIIIKLQQKQ